MCSEVPCADIGTRDLQVLPEVDLPWRKEVIGAGKYWQWRRGSGNSRVCRYGGTFRTLSLERQAEYAKNVEKRAGASIGTRGPGDAPVSDRVLPAGRAPGAGR